MLENNTMNAREMAIRNAVNYVYLTQNVEEQLKTAEMQVKFHDYCKKFTNPEDGFMLECNLDIKLTDRMAIESIGVDLDGMIKDTFRRAWMLNSTVGEMLVDFIHSMCTAIVDAQMIKAVEAAM